MRPTRCIRGLGRRMLAIAPLLCGILAAPGADAARPVDRSTPLHRIEMQVDEESMASLRRTPRTDVAARTRVDGGPPIGLNLHLKGATGSFRPVDDRPSFTLSTAEGPGSGTVLGTSKWHLNNSVEDLSRWREILGREMLGDLGFPTTTATHSRVVLNGRDLGLYVLIEGFTPEWISRSFPGREGIIFETVATADGAPESRPVAQRGDRFPVRLPAPFLAAPTLPVTDRWNLTAGCINETALMGFIAAEVLLGHADGYSIAGNNHRLWLPSDGSGLQWIPHGFDRLFTVPDLPWPPAMSGPMAEAFMARPDGAGRVLRQIRDFRDRLPGPSAVKTRLDGRMERLRPHLRRAEWSEMREGTDQLVDDWRRRWETLDQQEASAQPVTVAPGSGTILSGWRPDPKPMNAELSEAKTPGGGSRLRILAHGACLAGWSWSGTLLPGRYRLEARVRLDPFEPLPFGGPGGVCLRDLGSGAEEWLRSASGNPQVLRLEFKVDPETTTTRLRISFRARRGAVDVDSGSLRVHRIGCLRQRHRSPGQPSNPPAFAELRPVC